MGCDTSKQTSQEIIYAKPVTYVKIEDDMDTNSPTSDLSYNEIGKHISQLDSGDLINMAEELEVGSIQKLLLLKIAVSKNSPCAFRRLGNAYFRAPYENFHKALKYYQKAFAREKSKYLYSRIGRCQLNLGMYQEAVNTLENAVTGAKCKGKFTTNALDMARAMLKIEQDKNSN